MGAYGTKYTQDEIEWGKQLGKEGYGSLKNEVGRIVTIQKYGNTIISVEVRFNKGVQSKNWHKETGLTNFNYAHELTVVERPEKPTRRRLNLLRSPALKPFSPDTKRRAGVN